MFLFDELNFLLPIHIFFLLLVLTSWQDRDGKDVACGFSSAWVFVTFPLGH